MVVSDAGIKEFSVLIVSFAGGLGFWSLVALFSVKLFVTLLE